MEQSNNSEKTPTKNLRTPNKVLKTPNKSSAKKKSNETLRQKALPFFDELGVREEKGSLNKYYGCQLCHKEIIGNNLWCLASHFQRMHEKEYAESIGGIDEDVQVQRLKLLQNCVSIIVLGGRPISSLMDFGFQEIIAKQLRQFAMAGYPLNLKHKSQPEVNKYLNDVAELVRKEIRNAIKDRPISIQLDMATRLGRSVFGIDVNYIQNSKVIIYNIGMMVLNKSHTGRNLLDCYRKCLQRYNIERKQVISVSADNGKDVQKMIRLEKTDGTEELHPTKKVARRLGVEVAEMYEISQREVDKMQEKDKQLQRGKIAQVDSDIEAILQTEELTDDNNAIDMIFDECNINLDLNPDTQQLDNLLIEITPAIASEHNHDDFLKMSGIRCAAHTVQIAVKKSLKALPEDTMNAIKLCGRIAKILRLESTKYYLEDSGLKWKKPRLTVETRWGSTYVMVSTFFITV